MAGIRERIIREIEAFLAETHMSQRAFGIGVTGDGKLLARIRNGFGVTLTTLENAERFMAEARQRSQQVESAMCSGGLSEESAEPPRMTP